MATIHSHSVTSHASHSHSASAHATHLERLAHHLQHAGATLADVVLLRRRPIVSMVEGEEAMDPQLMLLRKEEDASPDGTPVVDTPGTPTSSSSSEQQQQQQQQKQSFLDRWLSESRYLTLLEKIRGFGGGASGGVDDNDHGDTSTTSTYMQPGQRAAARGTRHKYPVFLVPGITSTNLESWWAPVARGQGGQGGGQGDGGGGSNAGSSGTGITSTTSSASAGCGADVYYRRRIWGDLLAGILLDLPCWISNLLLDPHHGGCGGCSGEGVGGVKGGGSVVSVVCGIALIASVHLSYPSIASHLSHRIHPSVASRNGPAERQGARRPGNRRGRLLCAWYVGWGGGVGWSYLSHSRCWLSFLSSSCCRRLLMNTHIHIYAHTQSTRILGVGQDD